jgi:ribosomal-protein-alanine N-acetyltransferase
MIEGKRALLRLLHPTDAPALLALYQRNAEHLTPWEVEREPAFYTLEAQREIIQTALVAAADDRGYAFGVVLRESGALIGRLTLSGIVRAAFQNAYLGYWLDVGHTGRGLMTEAVRLALGYAFGTLGLHRVQAATLPHNMASIRVLRKCGFRQEGLAERYLRIAGRWQDHAIFAITAEEWPTHEVAEEDG